MEYQSKYMGSIYKSLPSRRIEETNDENPSEDTRPQLTSLSKVFSKVESRFGATVGLLTNADRLAKSIMIARDRKRQEDEMELRVSRVARSSLLSFAQDRGRGASSLSTLGIGILGAAGIAFLTKQLVDEIDFSNVFEDVDFSDFVPDDLFPDFDDWFGAEPDLDEIRGASSEDLLTGPIKVDPAAIENEVRVSQGRKPLPKVMSEVTLPDVDYELAEMRDAQGSYKGKYKVVHVSNPDTGSGWTVEGQKDAHGRPIVYTRAAAEAVATMIEDSGGAFTGRMVTSSQRSPAKNKAVKGATNSKHLKGTAMDISRGTSGNKWVATNGKRYGWIQHKYRASNGNMVTWHFEFRTPPKPQVLQQVRSNEQSRPRSVSQPSITSSGTKPRNQKERWMLSAYEAFREFGTSDLGAKVMVAQIGRENSFNEKHLFGYHIDPKNKAINAGIISWQGSRARKLIKFLAEEGVFRNNKIERSERSLRAQIKFLLHEMSTGSGKWKKAYNLLKDPSASYQDVQRAVGKNYILWRIDDPKYRSTGLRNQRAFFDQIERIAGNSRDPGPVSETSRALQQARRRTNQPTTVQRSNVIVVQSEQQKQSQRAPKTWIDTLTGYFNVGE